jgi:hypothetical protein
MMERIQGGHPAGVASLNLPSYEDQVRTKHKAGLQRFGLAHSGLRLLAFSGVFRDEPVRAQHSHLVVVVL